MTNKTVSYYSIHSQMAILFVWGKKSIRNLLKMLIKLWVVSTRKMLIKLNVLLNRNGLPSCSWNIWCCRWVMWFVSQLLLLNQHNQANLSAVFLLKWQSPFSTNNESRKSVKIRQFTRMWSLFVSITPSPTPPGWLMVSPLSKAHVSFKPTMDQQRKCPKCSSTAVDGNFVVQYDVNRETTGGELEVSVAAQLGPESCE